MGFKILEKCLKTKKCRESLKQFFEFESKIPINFEATVDREEGNVDYIARILKFVQCENGIIPTTRSK